MQPNPAAAEAPGQESDGRCLCPARTLPEFLCLLCIGEDHGKWSIILREVAALTWEKRSHCVYSSLVERFLYIYTQSHNQRGDDDLAKHMI